MFHFLCFYLKMNSNAKRCTEYCTSLEIDVRNSNLDLLQSKICQEYIVSVCARVLWEYAAAAYLNTPNSNSGFYCLLQFTRVLLSAVFFRLLLCVTQIEILGLGLFLWMSAQAFAWYMCHALFSVDVSNSLAMDYYLNRFDQFGFSCARERVCDALRNVI